MDKVPVYLLAGGKSSRFGRDKARVSFNREPLFVHAAAAVQTVASETWVVADTAHRYADLGLPGIADVQPGRGPLGGLEAALNHRATQAGDGWLLLAACDMVGLEAVWLQALLACPDAGDKPLFAAAFREESAGRKWQPFPSLWHVSALAAVTAALAEGKESLWRMLDALNAVAVPLPEHWTNVIQVNTPEDLDRARSRLAQP